MHSVVLASTFLNLIVRALDLDTINVVKQNWNEMLDKF